MNRFFIATVTAMVAALFASPATAYADPPPPPANCDQDSADSACQPRHHRKFCGFVYAFPIRCHHHDDSIPSGDPPPPAGP
jgi:hypothetical protein